MTAAQLIDILQHQQGGPNAEVRVSYQDFSDGDLDVPISDVLVRTQFQTKDGPSSQHGIVLLSDAGPLRASLDFSSNKVNS